MKKINLGYDRIKIMIFAGGLAVLFLTNILNTPAKFSETENRYLAERPKLTVKNLINGSYMKDYETFITDQFPERSFFTGLKTFSERLRGRTDDNGVYFGKEKTLIGKYDTILFESEKAKKNKEYLVEFAKTYEKNFGKEHLKIVMVPSSSEIEGDKLPPFAPVYNQTAYIERMKAEIGESLFIDAGESLKRHTGEYIYYRTDHHWTTLGAYYTYEDICKASGKEAKRIDEFKKEVVSDEFLGTYDSKVNTRIFGGSDADSITLYSLPEAETAVMRWDESDKKEYRGIYDREALSGKDKYSVFMGGNHGITDIRVNEEKGKTLLIIKDSFAHSIVPFFIEDYNRIVMVDLRHFNKSLKEYIDENEVSDILVLYSIADFIEDNNIAKLLR